MKKILFVFSLFFLSSSAFAGMIDIFKSMDLPYQHERTIIMNTGNTELKLIKRWGNEYQYTGGNFYNLTGLKLLSGTVNNSGYFQGMIELPYKINKLKKVNVEFNTKNYFSIPVDSNDFKSGFNMLIQRKGPWFTIIDVTM